MATMAALHSSMASLSLSSNSFLGQRLALPVLHAPCRQRKFGPCWTYSMYNPSQYRTGGKKRPLIKLSDQQCTVVMRLKRWERKECKPNSLPVLHKMHVKVGDTVKLIAGHEKGKIGEITRIFRHNSTVIVTGLNLKTKHMKSREQGEPGQIVKIEGPIHSSNVMLYSKEKEIASRVAHKILENGTRVRYLIKTGEIIDSAENWKRVTKERNEKKEEKSS